MPQLLRSNLLSIPSKIYTKKLQQRIKGCGKNIVEVQVKFITCRGKIYKLFVVRQMAQKSSVFQKSS